MTTCPHKVQNCQKCGLYTLSGCAINASIIIDCKAQEHYSLPAIPDYEIDSEIEAMLRQF